MTKAERAELTRIKEARIAALHALGYNGRIPKERFLSLAGLVHEKTAAQLLGVSRKRLRELVEPEQYVRNPVFLTAPEVPVYDPRQLLRTLRALKKNPTLCRPVIARVRRAIDEDMAQAQRDFMERGRSHAATLRERARERAMERTMWDDSNDESAAGQ